MIASCWLWGLSIRQHGNIPDYVDLVRIEARRKGNLEDLSEVQLSMFSQQVWSVITLQSTRDSTSVNKDGNRRTCRIANARRFNL